MDRSMITTKREVMQQLEGIEFQHFAQSELRYIQVSNAFCEAKIALQGGQILEFYSKAQQRHLLWWSELNRYIAAKAIRGGIPLCFPWFGTHDTEMDFPAHGFARNLIWQCKDIVLDDLGHHITLQLKDSEQSRKYWNYAFNLQMIIHCGEHLTLELILQNLDKQAFEFNFAWHSYFPADTQQAQISGLQGEHYIDQLDQNQIKPQTEAEIVFDAELDRIYPITAGQFVLQQNLQTKIYIKSTAQSAVIWNPWVEKAQRLTDVADDAWQDFVCIECGQIASQKQSLSAGESIQFVLELSGSVSV